MGELTKNNEILNETDNPNKRDKHKCIMLMLKIMFCFS